MTVDNKRNQQIPQQCEFRFEVDRDEYVSIRLVSGSAELFGMEMAMDVDYPFDQETKASIFSWPGAEVEMSSSSTLATDYIAEETPIPIYFQLHLALERMRALALPPTIAVTEDEVPGPHVLLIGERESGKTALIKTLANWAIRSGRSRTEIDTSNTVSSIQEPDEGEGKSRGVMLVNLDPSEGAMTMPGTFSLAPIYTAIASSSPVHVLGTTVSTGTAPSIDVPADLPQPNPVTLAPACIAQAFWYGSTEWNGRNNKELQSALLKRSGELCLQKMAGEVGLWRGGMLIDSPGEWAEKSKADTILQTVREYEVNVLVVVGSERLHVEMTRLLSTNKTVTVLRIPKSGGACDLDMDYRRRNLDRQIHSYFYGGPAYSAGKLSPHSFTVGFEYLKVFRIGEEYHAPDSALPIGATRATRDTQLVEIDPTEARAPLELSNTICALMQAEDDADDVTTVDSPVLGFIHIADVDSAKKKFVILSPMPGRLPRKRAILSHIQWTEK